MRRASTVVLRFLGGFTGWTRRRVDALGIGQRVRLRMLHALSFFALEALKRLLNLAGVEFQPMTPLYARRQFERTEGGTHEAADGQSERREHAAYQAIPAFANAYAIPAVGALSTLGFHHVEPGRAIVEGNAAAQRTDLFGTQFADQAYGIIAARTVARMRQTIGEFTRVGEDEQPAGVVVESANRDPAAAPGDRDAIEDARASFGIAVAYNSS